MLKKKRLRRCSFALCVCIVLATCLCVPTVARTFQAEWSTSTSESLRDQVVITGFAGQAMLHAYAVKTGSGTSTSTTAYVDNLNIEKYSVNMSWHFYMEYGGDNGETFIFGNTVSTTSGAEQLSVAVNYSQVYSENRSLFSTSEMNFSKSYAIMTVQSTCPYPQDLPYTDTITFPSLAD